MADGRLGNTPILLDDTITVIDGGKILTGSVTANQIAANAITADKIAANSIHIEKMSDDAKEDILNSNIESRFNDLITTNKLSEAIDAVNKGIENKIATVSSALNDKLDAGQLKT
jgi:hypothetical protein